MSFSGNMIRGLLDNIHWDGIFLFLSENLLLINEIIIMFLLYSMLKACHIFFFSFEHRSLAEFSRIPVVVTNQVRSQRRDEVCQYSFQGLLEFCICENLLPDLLTEYVFSHVQHKKMLKLKRELTNMILMLLLLWEFIGLILSPFVLCLKLNQVCMTLAIPFTKL